MKTKLRYLQEPTLYCAEECGCGGAQVTSSRQIGKTLIKKIKVKKGLLRSPIKLYDRKETRDK